MRDSSSVGRARDDQSPEVDGSSPSCFSFIFAERRERMSIEQLDLLLCDTYQMDAWFPFGWKWKKELEKSSYSVWAIDELKRYIVGRLYPKKSGSVEDFITFVGDFRRIMNQFSKINPDNNFMFSVAADISTDVLDLLHAMK